jgi:hypothetical protein
MIQFKIFFTVNMWPSQCQNISLGRLLLPSKNPLTPLDDLLKNGYNGDLVVAVICILPQFSLIPGGRLTM